MKNFILYCLLLLAVTFEGKTQLNYVYNGSFEILYGCPNNLGQIDSAIGWHKLINNTGGSSDLFNICSNQASNAGIPINIGNTGYQYPHSGNGYAGVGVILSPTINGGREYIQSQLIGKLKPGSMYCVKFYASLLDGSLGSIKKLGAFFDDGSISPPPLSDLANALPQVYNSILQLNDKINWMKIEGSFIASGNEDYITIGNFFTDAQSDTVIIGSQSNWYSYYYIDDVSVIDADLNAYAGRDTIVHHPGDSVFIGRHSEVGLDEDCIWFVQGIPIDTVAGMWVKPENTTTYVVQQTICGNVKYDTVTITVSGDGVEQYLLQNKWLKVYPNPAQDAFYVEYSGDNVSKEIELELYNIYGAFTKKVQVSNKNKFTVSTIDIPSGIYYYQVRLGNDIIEKDKIVIIK